jgi:hypothetical protein
VARDITTSREEFIRASTLYLLLDVDLVKGEGYFWEEKHEKKKG